MRLYAGTSRQFIEDTIQNQIAEKLAASFFEHFRYIPPESEKRSWKNSLRAVKDVFERSKLYDHGIILEYQLPLTSKRLDCLICGQDKNHIENAVIIELKQWDKCEESDGENEVMTFLGHDKRDLLHPSKQVGQYQMWLSDTHTAFYAGSNPIILSACSYLHNYNYVETDVLFAPKFKEILDKYPLFTADDFDKICDYLSIKLDGGNGLEVLNKIEKSKYRPSKQLMDHVARVIKGKSEYILLDEQLVVYDRVLATARKGFHDKRKTVMIIKGGPGTGKSVIAINLMADLLTKGYNAHYATGSRAFTTTLRKIIGTRGAIQFKYFNGYSDAEANVVDVLICDEAHRIRETSNSRYTPKDKKSDLLQIQELIDASKVAVFLLDDNQTVRPNEIGSVEYIKKNALANKCELHEYELEAQFRCQGSDAFVNWINNTLEIKKTANILWNQNDKFDFKIFDNPLDLEKAIRKKAGEGFKARMTGGFCWKWSVSNKDGTLLNDMVIDDYHRPWNARPEAKKFAPGVPPAVLWAYDPDGIDQVGCVYTAQGFEFDYVGVIFGNDLTYSLDRQQWEGHPDKSFDTVVRRSKGRFADLVKNTYRILLSRGIMGCYVYFLDKETEQFFKSRMEKGIIEPSYIEPDIKHIIIESIDEKLKYQEFLPVYSFKAAAGYFGEGREEQPEGWMNITQIRKLNKLMFVCKVTGHSMEPIIPDGRYCIFKANVAGTRQGKILLVQHRSISDPEIGGSYTVKEYRSTKKYDRQGNWEHEEIQLIPKNKEFKPINIPSEEAEDFRVIGELIEVLK